METLNEIVNEESGIMVAESHIVLTSKLCSRIYVIEMGKIIASGQPAKYYPS